MFVNQRPFKGRNHRLVNFFLHDCDDPEAYAFWEPLVNAPGSEPADSDKRHYWRKKFLRLTLPPPQKFFTVVKECPYCFGWFEPTNRRHKYCCNSCRSNAPRYRRRNAHLPDGGKKFLKSGRRRFRRDVEARRENKRKMELRVFVHDLYSGS